MNCQNCRIWCSENPYAIQDERLHSQKCNVLCALWAREIIGLYFFERNVVNAFPVNDAPYREMSNTFYFNETIDLNLNGMWFQHVGWSIVTRVRERQTLSQMTFAGCATTLRSNINYSSDILRSNYIEFFFGAIWRKGFVNKPATIPKWKENIRAR